MQWLEVKYAEIFDVASVTPSDVQGYKQHLIRAGRASATVNRALVVIGKFAKWCVTQDMRQDYFGDPLLKQRGLVPSELRTFKALQL
jgi:site-specific recombinase XerD